MKKLSEAMIDTLTIAPQTPHGMQNSIAQHGSMQEVGKANGQSRLEKLNNSAEAENQKKPQSEECSERKIPISSCLGSKKKLTLLVKSCFESLNTYGAGNDALEASIMLMQMTLGRFDYDTVRRAFEVHLQQSSDMPKPADIVKIIEPPKEKRKWCAITFIDLRRKQREGQFITKAEKQYMQDFIAAKISESDNAGMIDDAIKEAETQDKRYWIE